MAPPRVVVDPPRPATRPIGLLDYVDWQPNDGPNRWAGNGVEWMAECSGGATIALDPCIWAVTGTSGTNAYSETESRRMRGATPFTVYSSFSCSPVDFYSRANQLAEDALRRDEGWQAEYTFWTGNTVNSSGVAATVYPHLAAAVPVLDGTVLLQPAATTAVTGTGLDPRTGLGILEEALATCYGGKGLIHVPLRVFTHLHGNGLLVRDGDRWRTAVGNWVVPGGGYPGTSPAGAAPANSLEGGWMYATSPIWGYRSDITVFDPPSNLNRSIDTVTARAARNYLLAWDCCLLALQVDAATT